MSRTAPAPVPIDAAKFRKACSQFATGITVATVSSKEGVPFGFTANSFTSVSCSPPLILICIDHRSSALPHFRTSATFGINVLEAGQRDLSVRFSQKQGDRFEGVDWQMSPAGVPLLDGVLAHLECSVTQIIEAGDHSIFIGEVFRAEWQPGRPLLYFGSCYCGLSGSDVLDR